MTKCDKCGHGVELGPLYRTNRKGIPGIFRHRQCGGIPHDPVVANLVSAIEQGYNQINKKEAQVRNPRKAKND